MSDQEYRRLIITLNGKDISNDCSLVEGKGNPFGWSQYQIHYAGKLVGWLENGEPMDMEPNYKAKIVIERMN